MDSRPNPANMSAPVKIGLLVASGASLGFIVRELARNSATAMWVLGIGVIVVLCAVGGFMLVQRLLRKGKSKQFAKGISPGKAGGGGTAQARAQREDLRRRFVEGLDKLRDRGIDPYEMPWYVVVGESGGGKTELLRRCGAAGAASYGMTDPLQGVGGTLNMNWWFYNRAVILDTAGRLWEDLGNPNSLSEWEEFLKLLVRSRKLTPINGLILVIPATSLIKDRADEIDSKTATMVDQLHRMRNALEIRFPVYIVVSKCDLIPGFREFFDHITQPDLQHQIIGWTNRQDIDQPVQLDALVPGTAGLDGREQSFLEHELNGLVDHFAERRSALLRDPTPAGPSGRRLDDVDNIFAFPDQFRQRVVPSLTQYVTKIFAAGMYDRKPLFLRGIYFTSSMREGSPLDDDLAQMLGMSLEQLSTEEAAPHEERAYFLTDLFDQKIFREPGLVSRSVAPRKQFRRWRAALVAFAFAGIAGLFALTFLASRRFRQGIGDDLALWRTAAKEYWETLPEGYQAHAPAVVPRARGSEDYDYKTAVKVGDDKLTIAQYHKDLAATLDHEINPPWLFSAFVGAQKLVEERREAQDVVYYSSVVVPLVQAARHRLTSVESENWTAVQRRVLSFLIRLEVIEPGSPRQAAAFDKADLDALMEHVLGANSEGWELYQADAARDALADLFVITMNESSRWAELRLGLEVDPDGRLENRPVAAGIHTMLEKVCTPEALINSEPAIPIYEKLAGLLAPLADAEQALLAVPERIDPDSRDWLTRIRPDVVPEILTDWSSRGDAFAQRSAEVVGVLRQLGTAALRAPAEQYQTVVSQAIRKAREDVSDDFLDQVGLRKPAEGNGQHSAFIEWVIARMEQQFAANAAALNNTAVSQSLQQFGSTFLTPLQTAALQPPPQSVAETVGQVDDIETVLELRRRIYRVVPEGQPADADALDAEAAWASPEKSIAAVAWLEGLQPEAYRVPEAAAAARAMITLRAAYMNHRRAQAVLATLPAGPEGVMSTVEGLTARPQDMPTIAFTSIAGGTFDARFTPEAATEVLSSWKTMRNNVQTASPMLQAGAISDSIREREAAFDGYLQAFADYWVRDLPNQLTIEPFESWPGAHRAVATTRAWEISTGFEDLCKQMAKAEPVFAQTGAEQSPQRWSEKLAEADRILKQVSSAAFTSQCSAVLRRWAQLPPDPQDMRSAVLRMSSADFLRDFFVFAPGSGDTMLHRYWRDLAMGLLATAVQDSKAAYGPLIERIHSYQRWPLNHPSALPALSPAEVAAAAETFEKLGLAGTQSADAAPAPGTGEPALDALLSDLGTVPIGSDDRRWIRKAEDVAGLIPASPVMQRNATLKITPPESGERYPFSRFWTWAVVSQGGRRLAQLNTADTSQSIDLTWHPGDELMLQFYLYPEDENPNKTLTVKGPWAPLKLLFESRSATAVDDISYGPGVPASAPGSSGDAATATWRIPVRMTDPQGNVRELRLDLQFDRPIPVEWPVK